MNQASNETYSWSHQLWGDRVNPKFLSDLREAVSQDVIPFAELIDRNDLYPLESVKRLARKGYTSLLLDEQWGGQKASFQECTALFEEASYASAAVGISLITILQAQTIIKLFGAPSLQEQVLPQFKQGLITSYALTEANHGSDIRQLDTKAYRVTNGWRLQGRKSFITSGSAAEAYIILAQTPVGVSTFFVPAQLPGISTEEGKNASTFGLRNGPHVDLILDEVIVPEDHLIGTEGKGIRQALTTLDFSRTVAGAISIGIARAAFDHALRFAAARKAFDQHVLDFQGIQWYFADMMSHIDAARLLVYEAANALDQHKDIDRWSSQAKLLASQVATRCAEKAIQICGAYGVTENAPLGRYLRDAKAYEIAGGSSEILKNTLGKHLIQFSKKNLATY